MADLRIEVWEPPGIATFERRISGIDGLMSISGSLYRRQLGRGTLVIPPNYDRLDDIIEVDPANHANDVASLVRVYRGATLMQEWLVSETPNVISEQPVIVAGDDVNAVMDWAIVEPWDWDGLAEFASRFPDWIYGGPNVLVDPTFTSPVCSPRISEFWTDATSGTWTATVDGDTTAGIAFNAGALAVESAYQALSTVNDVLVEGTGEPSTPWRVTFVDPCFPTTYSVSSGTLNNAGLVTTLIQLGAMEPGGWTVSKTLSTGVPITFGNYTNFEVDTPPVPAPSGTNTALHVQATTPVGFSYPGAQTTPSVQPGGLYQGGVWVYSQGTADEVRLVIRPLDEEPLIASSTWPSTSISANTWTFLPATNIQIPESDSRIIFRVASVQNSHAVNLWITDAELNAGLPPANAGEIMDDLLADAQTDHAPARETLTFIKPSYTAALDSSGTAWPGLLLIDIPRGMTYRKVLESKFGPLGYEWNVRPDLLIPGEWWLDLWAPGTRVTDVTADETPSLLVGQGTLAGYGTKSVPKANRVTAEGASQYTARVENTASQPVIGVREAYVADISYVATSTDDYAQQTLDKFLDFSLAPRFDIADSDDWPIPILDYGLATRLNVDLADGAGKFSRDVEAFTYQQTDGLVWTIHTGVAQFDQPIFRNVWGGQDQNPPDIVIAPPETNPRPGTPILGGVNRGGVPVSGYAPQQNPLGLMGPTIEGTRWLLDEFSRLRMDEAPSSFTPSGGGGMAYKLIAAADEPESILAKADLIVGPENLVELQNAISSLPAYATVWLAGFWFFLTGGTLAIPTNMTVRGFHRTVLNASGDPITVTLGAQSGLLDLEVGGDISVTCGNNSFLDNIYSDSGNGTGALLNLTGTQVNVGKVLTFGTTYAQGVVNVEGNDCRIGDLQMTGDDVGIRALDCVGLQVGRVRSIGVESLLDFNNCDEFVIEDLNDTGSGGGTIAIQLLNCDGGSFVAGQLDGTGGTNAIVADTCTRITWGEGFKLENSLNSGLLLDDSTECRFHGSLLECGASSVGTFDALTIAGTSAGNRVQSALITPRVTGLGATRYAINHTASGVNYAAGNDFGDVSSYTGSPAVNVSAGTLELSWPADATYGDNFQS